MSEVTPFASSRLRVNDLLEKHFETAFAAPDGIKRLRELILTLAMQGRLVPQDPNDPPASELLKKIEAEKQRLIKEKKIRKPKALPPIEPEEVPYELPPGWEWVRLGNVLQFINGDRGKNYPSKDKLSNEGIPFISAVNLENGTVSSGNLLCVSEAQYQKLGSGKLELDDLVFCIRGSLGKSAIYPFDIGAIASSLVILRQYFKNKGFLLYLYQYVSSPFLFHEIRRYDNGTAQPNLSASNLKKFLFPLPPLPEQHRIVVKIDQLMARCDELEKLRAEQERLRLEAHAAAVRQLLDTENSEKPAKAWRFLKENFSELYTVKENVAELRKAILQLAVMGRLVPQDPNDPPASELLKEIEAEKQRLIKEKKSRKPKKLPPIKPEEVPYDLPPGWVWVRLGECMLKITDGTHHSPPNGDVGDFLYISAKNIKDDGVLLDNATYVTEEIHKEIFSRCDPEFGNILYVKDGATTGIVTINTLKEPFSMLSSVALLKQPSQIYNKFLLITLRSPFFYQKMRAGMTGVAITRITLKKLNNALIPLPPLPEQHRIVAKIDQLMALCDELEQQIEALTSTQAELLDSVMACLSENGKKGAGVLSH